MQTSAAVASTSDGDDESDMETLSRTRQPEPDELIDFEHDPATAILLLHFNSAGAEPPSTSQDVEQEVEVQRPIYSYHEHARFGHSLPPLRSDPPSSSSSDSDSPPPPLPDMSQSQDSQKSAFSQPNAVPPPSQVDPPPAPPPSSSFGMGDDHKIAYDIAVGQITDDGKKAELHAKYHSKMNPGRDLYSCASCGSRSLGLLFSFVTLASLACLLIPQLEMNAISESEKIGLYKIGGEDGNLRMYYLHESGRVFSDSAGVLSDVTRPLADFLTDMRDRLFPNVAQVQLDSPGDFDEVRFHIYEKCSADIGDGNIPKRNVHNVDVRPPHDENGDPLPKLNEFERLVVGRFRTYGLLKRFSLHGKVTATASSLSHMISCSTMMDLVLQPRPSPH